jgi:hypothetical protein
MDFPESEAQKRQREADTERRRGDLLGEQDQPDLAEQIERGGDRPRDQQGRQRALRAPCETLNYSRQRPASLKYLIAAGW